MRKITTLLTLVILSAGVARAQSNWVNYKIDDKLSVKFPHQPAVLEEHSVYAKDGDSTLYMVASIDFAKIPQKLDSAQLAAVAPTMEFANEFKGGMLSQMPGSTLGDVTIGKWNGYTSYTMDGGNAANKQKLYTFMVLIGTKIYSLMAIMPENYSTSGKSSFFGSLTLN